MPIYTHIALVSHWHTQHLINTKACTVGSPYKLRPQCMHWNKQIWRRRGNAHSVAHATRTDGSNQEDMQRLDRVTSSLLTSSVGNLISKPVMESNYFAPKTIVRREIASYAAMLRSIVGNCKQQQQHSRQSGWEWSFSRDVGLLK